MPITALTCRTPGARVDHGLRVQRGPGVDPLPGLLCAGLLAFVLATLGLAPSIARGALPQAGGSVDLATEANIVLQGPSAGAEAGYSVAGAGDVNGDGIDDIVVGAWKETALSRSAAGAAYVIFGASTLTSVDLATPGTHGFRIVGATASSSTGQSVAGAGDVNGDGIDDVIVGAPNGDPGALANAGSATVIFGSRGALSDIDLADPLGTRGFEINGAAAGDYAGVSVAGAGDVNGDGIDDVIVGANGTDFVGRVNAGSAFVVYGSVAPASLSLGSLGSRGFRIDGERAADWLGTAVSRAGDFNDDGIADVMVGAPWAARPTTSDYWTGVAYVIFGSANPTDLDAGTLPGARGLRFDGAAVGSRTGVALAAAGDVNDDGLDDILIGAPGSMYSTTPTPGVAYVLLGSPTPSSLDLSAAIPSGDGFRVTGGANGNWSGFSVAGVGDFNGDGIHDFMIGAQLADPASRLNAGKAYVVYGRSGASDLSLASLASDAGVTIDGAAANDTSGVSVAGAGDVNGDGRPDVLDAAPSADPETRMSAGAVYAIFGFGPPSIAYSSGVAATAGTPLTPLAPTVARTGTASFDVAPALPSGLALDPITGVISGTPTAASDESPHVVTMTDDVGTASATVQVTVLPNAAPSPDPFTVLPNAAPSPDPSSSGEPVMRATLSAPLRVPAGKAFVVRLRVANVATSDGDSRSSTTATAMAACVRLPRAVRLVRAQRGAKVTGRVVCWNRRSLRAGSKATFALRVRGATRRGAPVRATLRATATASNVNGVSLRALARSAMRITLRAPRAPVTG